MRKKQTDCTRHCFRRGPNSQPDVHGVCCVLLSDVGERIRIRSLASIVKLELESTVEKFFILQCSDSLISPCCCCSPCLCGRCCVVRVRFSFFCVLCSLAFFSFLFVISLVGSFGSSSSNSSGGSLLLPPIAASVCIAAVRTLRTQQMNKIQQTNIHAVYFCCYGCAWEDFNTNKQNCYSIVVVSAVLYTFFSSFSVFLRCCLYFLHSSFPSMYHQY